MTIDERRIRERIREMKRPENNRSTGYALCIGDATETDWQNVPIYAITGRGILFIRK